MITFQKLIFLLTKFWEKQGCVIHQGHDLEVGAGTFNPATSLRCLGPEPYKAAYVEPSRRPSDGRFGENPNRLQLFHQFQVILKPSPSNVQDLYLKSLNAIGLHLEEHDIRFVHDDWEAPTLGAWGLGWEVWCDGMEVSQFTYFQGMATLSLKPITAEITYGLERLCMFIQNKRSIFDIFWNDKLTLRDISLQSEVEWSGYNFTHASTEMWLRHFDDYEKEAKRVVSLHLSLPAYDFVVKASHAFNILDARGILSTTERTGYIGRIRELAHLCAMEYVASREKLSFPLHALAKEPPKQKARHLPKTFNASQRRDFVFEIGSEELPATFVPIGQQRLEEALRALFEKEGLLFDKMTSYATPRRIAVKVEALIEGVAPQKMVKKGPSISACFDNLGNWTLQGTRFFQSISNEPLPSLDAIRKGQVRDVHVESIKETDYLFVTFTTPAKSTVQILGAMIPTLIANLEFPKKMRWGSLDVTYARPIRWIVALFGHEVVPFFYGDVVSSRFTFGHAQHSPEKITLQATEDYPSKLKDHFVLADVQERKNSILSQISRLEDEQQIRFLEVPKVLTEVLYLTEWPQLVIGSFDAAFLRAPKEVLMSEMIEHQKYFPIGQAGGHVGDGKALKNLFAITCDNTPSALIQEGNEKVLSARFADGVFLYEQGLNTSLEEFNQKLKHVIFQKELGSFFDKVKRITSIIQTLHQQLNIGNQDKIQRASLLCKADLVTPVVKEFPELQGTMGKYYALAQKEDPEVALSIEEHWMPKAEGAALPTTPTGILLCLADKIDNLLGYYSVGLKPSSSSDPYGLRRQTIGILKILIEGRYTLDLKHLLQTCKTAFSSHESKLPPSLIEEVLKFITTRAKGLFEEFGFQKDEIEASLRSLCIDPYDQFCQIKALHTFRKTPAFGRLFEVYKRARGQLTHPTTTPISHHLAEAPAEKQILELLNTVEAKWPSLIKEKQYTAAYELLAKLQPTLAHLFDTVKILADDPKIRENRLALLQKVFSYFSTLLDFGKIQDKMG